jgi:hypothetical protein
MSSLWICDAKTWSIYLFCFQIIHLTIPRMYTITLWKWYDITQLKSLEVGISKSFLVYFILNSFPKKYDSFNIYYNKHKKNNQLMNYLHFIFKKKEDWDLRNLKILELFLKQRNGKNSKTTFKVKKHGHVSINKYDNISKCFFIREGTC